MGGAEFAILLKRIDRLKLRQQEWACLHLARRICGERVVAIIEQARRPHLCCPRCSHAGVWRDGHANGLQRYRCKQCGRTFNALTGTPLARLRLKGRWLDYCDSLRDPGCTVHQAASRVGVHANTSFRWRHRFLAWARHDRPHALQGIVEIAAACYPHSLKGAKHLTRRARKRGCVKPRAGGTQHCISAIMARDRSGATIDFIANGARPEAASLEQHLLPKLQHDVLLVSGGDGEYRRFAHSAHIAHRVLGEGRDTLLDLATHLQNVSAYQSRYHGWLGHFNGVATRYFNHYLGWHWAIDLDRIGDAATFLRAALGVFRT